MRISPLHNIRQQGLIPNGFPKEQAPPPVPDHAMQPEMRNRVEAQSDTRHAVELLNPRTRLETNGLNRSNTVDTQAAYERLLRILLGQDRSSGQSTTQFDPATVKHPPADMTARQGLSPGAQDRHIGDHKPDYYQRRCAQAYRSAQAIYGESTSRLKV